ncbi:lasso peptide biosynthesis B2 protein [Bacillus sp. 1P10SD]|uniref:lasso peptide biosynthesis B2 protein n=1 Tax=Bacillus sp. 1P10SD TaxID=3132265 RepID=UPI0039A43CB3
MNLVRKVGIFLGLDFLMKKLLFEAFILLGWARIQKSRSFLKVSPLLGEKMEETPFIYNDKEHKMARRVAESIHLMSKYTLWESQCLVKAIAAMKMLEKRDIESTLYLGTSKDTNGKLIAHAWLRTGPYFVTGYEGMEKFTVISSFAKRIKGSRGELS